MASGDFQVRWEQLAGGDALQGVPGFVKPIQDKFKAIQLDLESEGSHCLCNGIALSIFTMLLAGGAAALIVLSGGPADLLFFVPGCVLAAGALILAAGIVINGVQTMREKRLIQEEMTELKKLPVKLADILSEIVKPEVTDTQIKTALSLFGDKECFHFVEGVAAQNVGDKRVIAACVAFPEELNKIDFSTKDRGYALSVLEALPLDLNFPELLKKLMAKIGVPTSTSEAQLLARRPALLTEPEIAWEMLRHLEGDVGDERLFNALFATVGIAMDEAQCLLFTRHPKAMGRHIEGKVAPFALALLKVMPVDWDNQVIMNKLFEIVGKAPTGEEQLVLARHPETFKRKILTAGRTFARLVDSDTNSSLTPVRQALKALIPGSNDRAHYKKRPEELLEMVREKPAEFTVSAVIPIFVDMDLPNKTAFLKKLGEKPVEELLKKCLEELMTLELAKSPDSDEKTALLQEIAKWPLHVMQNVYVSKKRLHLETAFFNTLFNLMDAKGQKLILEGTIILFTEANKADATKRLELWINHFAESGGTLPLVTQYLMAGLPLHFADALLAIGEKNAVHSIDLLRPVFGVMNSAVQLQFPQTYIQALIASDTSKQDQAIGAWLNCLRKEAALFPDVLVIHFYKQHPEKMKELVDNKADLALYLLSNMEVAAEKAIATIDDGNFVGYTHYNSLLSAMKLQMDSDLSDDMKLLAARLKYAPQAGKTVLIGKDTLDTTGLEWRKFNSIAAPFQTQVWVKK